MKSLGLRHWYNHRVLQVFWVLQISLGRFMVLLAGGIGDLSFPIAILIENDGVPLGLLFDALIL